MYRIMGFQLCQKRGQGNFSHKETFVHMCVLPCYTPNTLPSHSLQELEELSKQIRTLHALTAKTLHHTRVRRAQATQDKVPPGKSIRQQSVFSYVTVEHILHRAVCFQRYTKHSCDIETFLFIPPSPLLQLCGVWSSPLVDRSV